MNISVLALKQKRLKDWAEFVEREVQDSGVQLRMRKAVKDYSNLIFHCFEVSAISEHDALAFQDLERELEELTELGRLKVTPRAVLNATTGR